MKKIMLLIVVFWVTVWVARGLAYTPSDPNLGLQPSLNLLRMQQAWDYEKGCPEAPAVPCPTKIGFAGTGFGFPPPFADVPVAATMDFSGSSNTWDDFGAAGATTSAVAIAGGNTDNALQNAGVMDHPTTYVAKTVNFGGTQTDAGLAAGINWLVEQGVKVIEIDAPPLGDAPQPLTLMAINNAVALKILVVVPASGTATTQKTWLANNADAKVVWTAGTSVAGTPVTWDATWDVIDTAAPADAVYTFFSGGCCGNRTASFVGAAHVTGVLALLRERSIGEWNIRRIIPLLRNPSTWDQERGWGVMDATCMFSLAADMDDNRYVDLLDVTGPQGVLQHYGEAGDSKWNVDGLGVVDISDALYVVAMFGASC